MKINIAIGRSVLLLALAGGLTQNVSAVTVVETNVTTANGLPAAIAVGSDGGMWFTEESASKIGRIDPATGVVSNEFATLTASAGPTGIAALGGFLWFTEQSVNKIARISISGIVEEFSTNISNALPNAIAIAPSNAGLYFVEKGTGKLGLIDAVSGAATEVSNVNLSSPAGIVKGPDDMMWISESGSDRITRFDPVSQVLTRFQIPVGTAALPTGIAVGPDNFIWFAMPGRNRIGKIDPFNSNSLTEYSSEISAGGQPNFIAMGSDGNLWYTTKNGGRIGRVTGAGAIVEFASGITSGVELRGIASDPVSGALFYASAANKIGKISNLDQIPATFRFEMEPFKVSEDCGEAVIKVIRDGDSNSAVSVDFATSDLSAKVSDDDYEATSGTLHFGVGVSSQTFTVRVFSGGGIESVEDVRLSLINATGGAEISTPSGTLQIFDGARLDDEGFSDTCNDVRFGGCALNRQRGFDPTLLLLLIFAGAFLIAKRRIR